ncbi:DUF998 domain-containing protein [Pseudonocardia nigra]|uniref:DUF998 domain-containing protein n=1 Tax=Pseudonocardia nigra TaxID=1921578 RepID=UPI0027E35F4E|nr:DUF998 domain-containing protein [Pseudonocardia nigra]
MRDPRTRLLLSGAVAGTAVFGVVSLAQAVTREGFDLTRYPLSSLSNGDLGWLQITNFVASGLLVLAGAVGLRRALRGTPGGTWAPRLVGVVGVGLALSGPFVLQGGGGFPVGDPGVPGVTVGTIGHLAVGTVAFTALIAACFVLGRHYARTGAPRMAWASRAAGAVFLFGDVYSSAGAPAGPLVLAVTFLTAMIWIAVVAHLERHR